MSWSFEMNMILPEVSEVRKNENGGNTILSEHVVNIFSQRPKLNFYEENIMVHSLIDSWLDKMSPDLEGESFSEKYKLLSGRHEYNIPILETYRILTLLRNAVVHNRSEINLEKGMVHFSYSFGKRGKLNCLRINSSYLKVLRGIAFIVSRLSGEIDAYHQLIISAMYGSVVNGLATMADRHGAKVPLDSCNGFNLSDFKWQSRYRCFQELGEVVDDKVSISRIRISDIRVGVDYFLSFDGKDFIVPGEILNDDNIIDIGELMGWEFLNKESILWLNKNIT